MISVTLQILGQIVVNHNLVMLHAPSHLRKILFQLVKLFRGYC